ncbi:uncharacterized protein SPPG_04054 [Spizellomyces punctatus DAOM BR117]|uniref:Uncharacterized protein n=1 Tax=Spizellomyces punctatus (strain DAOM BR117) TaxID=645134 RepID=A0A0L0HJD5_SPIPD|nr:uncharacterized protein SPPG_04054 [Spizellomyces punctatus DAOM BR117]KND00954.1 hypothetical protein SPPG_04054 [Spizellomyces punctatus DAOM BR117]|eukprot:XP_016608993.1 hypothetical protein SPPG_04054 [Spizellomyces punctatus DAOM BR117]
MHLTSVSLLLAAAMAAVKALPAPQGGIPQGDFSVRPTPAFATIPAQLSEIATLVVETETATATETATETAAATETATETLETLETSVATTTTVAVTETATAIVPATLGPITLGVTTDAATATASAPGPVVPSPVLPPICRRAGCNGELCVVNSRDAVLSPCVWKPEFACYNSATCGYNATARACGWQNTVSLRTCISAARQSAQI